MPRHHQRGAPALRPKQGKQTGSGSGGAAEGAANGSRRRGSSGLGGAAGGGIKSPRGSGSTDKKMKISPKKLIYGFFSFILLLMLYVFYKMHSHVSSSSGASDGLKLRGSNPATAKAASNTNGGDTKEHDQLAKMLEGAGAAGQIAEKRRR